MVVIGILLVLFVIAFLYFFATSGGGMFLQLMISVFLQLAIIGLFGMLYKINVLIALPIDIVVMWADINFARFYFFEHEVKPWVKHASVVILVIAGIVGFICLLASLPV